MIPVGYMYKTISDKPDWLRAEQVTDIYSVSSCVSEDFDDWINYWKHNGYWFFDSPGIIENLSRIHGIKLEGMRLFFYLAYEKQWDDDDHAWKTYQPEKSFPTDVKLPKKTLLDGFDIVSFSGQTSAECSPLSCNHLAQELAVNKHCLIESIQEAKQYLQSGHFKDCEPGPYRIFEVRSVVNA